MMSRLNFSTFEQMFILFCSMAILSGCNGSTSGTSDSQCNDAECFGVCIENDAWDGMTDSYWKFEAFCSDSKTCQCLSGCDNDKCNDYCVDEKGGTSGSCDIFDCLCEGVPEDAGEINDAGPPDDAGKKLDTLLSSRAENVADENTKRTKEISVLRVQTMGLLNQFRDTLIQEIAVDQSLPRDLEAKVFSYMDQIAEARGLRFAKNTVDETVVPETETETGGTGGTQPTQG